LQTAKKAVVESIDRIKSRLIELSDQIHANPELGYSEFKTSKLLASELESSGFDVTLGVSNLPTAFRAQFQSGPGPRITLLAEYDALPGIGHACGHNIIGVAAVGAALAVKQVLPQLSGAIQVFGTPAEEGTADNSGGKIILLEEIKNHSDVVLMVHPEDSYSVDQEGLAREAFEIEFLGKAAHASISPEEGINALDAVIMTFNSINALRQHLKSDVRIHGIITHGGDSPNLVPHIATARFYARSESSRYLGQVMEKLKRCAEGAALATGAKLNFRKTSNLYEPILANHVVRNLVERNIALLGMAVEDPADRIRRKGQGSTDFGNVSQALPGVSVYVPMGPLGLNLHTRESALAARSDLGHKGLLDGAKIMAMTSIDLLHDPDLVRQAKEEFNSQKAKET
jgi:amidohydrolase